MLVLISKIKFSQFSKLQFFVHFSPPNGLQIILVIFLVKIRAFYDMLFALPIYGAKECNVKCNGYKIENRSNASNGRLGGACTC